MIIMNANLEITFQIEVHECMLLISVATRRPVEKRGCLKLMETGNKLYNLKYNRLKYHRLLDHCYVL